ncbi:MexC family multidrug efflux RND transporter periplasmic adaptor subunit [Halopseudomonas pachastrellae]|nr:MexC family multidrug efflux RND transporter periplasmic adaptor subunit [Halopseudomonas pachastrellae]|tara:strand:- start:4705 stop:5850 length:1146 start_codon:yes stop_codon:yes gene_type:complete
MGKLGAVGIVVGLVVLLSGCGQSSEPGATGEVVHPVDVAVVSTEALTLTSELPGRIEPVRVAEVRARVAGIVLLKRFQEGADVKAGDLLFQIDPAPLKAAVSRAEGDLQRAEAAQQEARARVRRYEPLVKIEAVSQQDFDTATADLLSAQASVRSAQADLETARLNLGYASVKAPISGRIGRALVTEGALVGQGETTLMARIQQLDPVYVDFSQSVADALRLREALKSGSLHAGSHQALALRVEGTTYEQQGELLFTDVSVDRSTGQVSLRGEFTNTDGLLLPGMYVRVTAPQGIEANAILVPQRAVQRNKDGGAYVMVIGADSRAATRQVQTGVMQGSRWQISQGLSSGDQVIVGGLAGLQPGSKVELRHTLNQQQTSSR